MPIASTSSSRIPASARAKSFDARAALRSSTFASIAAPSSPLQAQPLQLSRVLAEEVAQARLHEPEAARTRGSGRPSRSRPVASRSPCALLRLIFLRLAREEHHLVCGLAEVSPSTARSLGRV